MKQTLGTGTVNLMGAEFAFLLSNYLIHIGLARYLGPAEYGLFGILTSLYLINHTFLNTGVPVATSKFLAETKEKAKKIFQVSFKLQLILALSFSLGYVLLAKFIADLLQDSTLTGYIIFLGIMVLPSAFFALHSSGYLNGLRMFKEQAIVKTIFPVSRVLFCLVLVLLGFKLWGVLVGYLLSLVLSLIICQYYLKKKSARSPLEIKKEEINSSDNKSPPLLSEINWKKMIHFALPLTVAALGLTVIRNINVLFLKSLLQDNYLAGLYTTAFTLSSATYMVFSALPFTLLPSISKALAEKKEELARKYISLSIRYLLILLLPITALVVATAPEVLQLFYSSTYVPAAPAFTLLMFSSVFLSLFAVLSSITSGSGRPKVGMILTIFFIVVLSVLNLYFIPQYELVGAALSTLITSFLAVIIVAGEVYRKFRVLTNFISAIKILFCSGVIFLLAHLWHYSGIRLMITYAVLFSIYLLLLFLFGEIKKEDREFVKKILKRGERTETETF